MRRLENRDLARNIFLGRPGIVAICFNPERAAQRMVLGRSARLRRHALAVERHQIPALRFQGLTLGCSKTDHNLLNPGPSVQDAFQELSLPCLRGRMDKSP